MGNHTHMLENYLCSGGGQENEGKQNCDPRKDVQVASKSRKDDINVSSISAQRTGMDNEIADNERKDKSRKETKANRN